MSDENTLLLNQYLSFTLGPDTYGINISNTKEVLESLELTRVPKMPPFMCGVINLRGSAVPVIDLESKFNIDHDKKSDRNNIIVTEIDDISESGKKIIMGIYTDSVQKVLTIEPENIEPAPNIGIPIDTSFIHGMGQIDDHFIILLNINKILSAKDLSLLSVEPDDSFLI